eukprot:scaffold1130_cov195-Pinguiococcus_pyrenoidosus.AAC.64
MQAFTSKSGPLTTKGPRSKYLHSRTAAFQACDTQVFTGRSSISRVQHFNSFKGNATLRISCNGRIDLSAADLSPQGRRGDALSTGLQFQPLLWEGYDAFPSPYLYLGRDQGELPDGTDSATKKSQKEKRHRRV